MFLAQRTGPNLLIIQTTDNTAIACETVGFSDPLRLIYRRLSPNDIFNAPIMHSLRIPYLKHPGNSSFFPFFPLGKQAEFCPISN
jgi:hypothetical protein